MAELEEISGKIISVIYRNDENGYAVVRVECDSGETTTVVGCFPYVAPGEMITAEGSWVSHAQHGKQFKAERSIRLLPTSADSIYEYLAGGTVRGIGPATAALIVNRFGEKTLDIMEMHPERLADIKGISAAKAELMGKSFKRQAGMRRLMEFLCAYKLKPLYALRLYKAYGNAALEVVHENPYILSSSHIGASFAEADAFALDMGVESDSPDRIASAVMFELLHNAGNGHCFIPRDKLTFATAQMIGVSAEAVYDGIAKLQECGELISDNVAGIDACYMADLYEAETYTADRIINMSGKVCKTDILPDEMIERLELINSISYAPLQKDAIRQAMSNQMLVITGGPGTGKTTIIKAVIEIFDELGMETVLAAPTGRAAKRMSELGGREAATIHRLLEAKMSEDGEKVVFLKGEDDLLKCDALILDECSMVDITLMEALLRALKPDCRLILVGDADQLPSVGPGKVFSDIIRSSKVPVVRLTEIFRQSEDSKIVRNAHMINAGEHPDFNDNTGDFFRLRRMQGGSTVDTIVELCAARLPQKMNIPACRIQVLSPTRKGETGTVNLNRRLQAALNPPGDNKSEKLFGEVVFRVGDRVMQTKNNYDISWKTADGCTGLGIYNGDIGIISAIDAQSESMLIDFDGRSTSYSFEMLNELEHAWALTVHKSQGSEYPAVILALNSDIPQLMTRGVLYTAVTRAKKLLIMVGDDSAAHRMIDNHKQSRRYSALRIRLCGENR